MVSADGEILGKPKDEADARRMLNLLSDDMHQVMTGLTVIVRNGDNVEEHVCVDIAEVHILPLAEDDGVWLPSCQHQRIARVRSHR